MRQKQVVCSLVSIFLYSPQLGIQSKQTIKLLDYWPKDMLKLNFSDKGLGLDSLPHSVYDFWRKMFIILYSINWLNFLIWLPLLLKILGYICVAILCYPGCDVLKFEINLIFLIKLFFYMAKTSRQKFK